MTHIYQCVQTLTWNSLDDSAWAPDAPQNQIQWENVPPKSGLNRMSYPFSNLSTVALATDIPELPVEELGATKHKSQSHFKEKDILFFDSYYDEDRKLWWCLNNVVDATFEEQAL